MIPAWLTPRLRFTLAALGFAQIINWGVLYYTLALIGPPIVRETGWSEAFVYSGFAIATLATGLFAPLSGSSIDRWGGLPVLLIGTGLGAAGMVLLAYSQNWMVYLFAWTMIGIGMSACLYDSTFASIARFAGLATRQSISLVTLIAGFASTLIWPLTSALLHWTDWRGVCLIDAGMMIFISAPLIFLGLHKSGNPTEPQSEEVAETVSPLASPPATQLMPKRNVIRAMIFFGLVLAAQGFVTNALSVHIITLFHTLEIDQTTALLASSLIGPAQVGARIVELVFGRKLSALGLGFFPVILMPLAFVILLTFTANPAIAILFGLLYGAGNGLATIARGVVPYALFGPDGYGRRLGMITSPALILKAGAPSLFGAILAYYGPVNALLSILLVSLVAFAAMVALVVLSKQKEGI